MIIISLSYTFFSDHIKEMHDKQKNSTVTVTEKNEIKNDTNKTIVLFKGSRYDITDFLKKHPGGKKILIDNNGKDIEKLMLENEHSKNAYKMLEKYKIK